MPVSEVERLSRYLHMDYVVFLWLNDCTRLVWSVNRILYSPFLSRFRNKPFGDACEKSTWHTNDDFYEQMWVVLLNRTQALIRCQLQVLILQKLQIRPTLINQSLSDHKIPLRKQE